MKTRALLKEGIATLQASDAIDHWQKDREKIEAEDLLAFVVGAVAYPLVRRLTKRLERDDLLPHPVERVRAGLKSSLIMQQESTSSRAGCNGCCGRTPSSISSTAFAAP